jgi:[ribosomal protein S5]-alanine N-acetyltransferase
MSHVVTRLVTIDDADVLAELVSVNRDFMRPFEPVRAPDYFTVEGQRAVVTAFLEQHAQGVMLPHLILDERGRVVGRTTLTGIVRGPFQSAVLGYWVDRAHNGRGLATAATADMVRRAFEDLGLHRVEAGVLEHNTGSRRVLERNGFVKYGLAPRFLNIAGRWQDHALYQRLNEPPDHGDGVTR